MRYKKIIFIWVALLALKSNTSFLRASDTGLKDSLTFYDGQQFVVIGKLHTEKNYVRFPQNYKGVVREEVWELGQNSAGISIRFRSNATTIAIRWTVMNDSNLPHMAATGVKGVDLYAYVNGSWQFVNAGFPRKKTNEFTVLSDGEAVYREYLLNLPLYDGVESLSIGVNVDAAISLPAEKLLTVKKPVVYYGSSIAQGACATRPGMAYTNILSRKLDRSFINLGFSGEGTFDESVGRAMIEADAALYIIDCNPNSKKEIVYERAVQLVKLLKEQKPDVPVLLVEGFYYDHLYFRKNLQAEVEDKRKELKRAYDALTESGIKGLYYKKGDELIGSDHEGTVDGVHPTDVGMERFAQQMLPVIQSILKKNKIK